MKLSRLIHRDIVTTSQSPTNVIAGSLKLLYHSLSSYFVRC